MTKRDNMYIHNDGDTKVEVEREGADGRMIFCTLTEADQTRNTRNEVCVMVPEDYKDLDDDMVLVYYDDSKGVILYTEVWKLFYLEPVNMVMVDDYEMKFLVPIIEFKSFTKEGWMEWDGSNITYNSIKDQLELDEQPSNINQQLNHFYDAIKKAKQG